MRFQDVTYNQIQKENQGDKSYMRHTLKEYRDSYDTSPKRPAYGIVDFSDIVNDFYHTDIDKLTMHEVLTCFRRIVQNRIHLQGRPSPEDRIDTNIYLNYPMRVQWTRDIAHSYDVLGQDRDDSAQRHANLRLREIRRAESEDFSWKASSQAERENDGVE